MASSGPDVVNATLGAAFGVAFGGVLTILDLVIEGLKFVYHCHEQCTSLREYLEKIKPMLSKISHQCQSEETLTNWLNAFQKCLEDANKILENCKDGSNWKQTREVFYGLEILKLKEKIMENVNISPMALLMLESTRKSSMGTNVMMQEVPQKILGMEDHFKRVKSTIIAGQSLSHNSRCVGIQGMGGCGKTLLAQMVNNDEEIQECFGKNSIFWMTVGNDASISSLFVRMRGYLHVEMACETPLEDQRTHLMNVFSTRKVLLILDDVWDNVHQYKYMVEWLNIARGLGSVTLVTTRDLSITRRINASVECLSLLSEEHSWELFSIHAFDANQLPPNQELRRLAKDVCNECKGLPLALKVIGATMKCKDDGAEWRSTLQDLRNATVDKDIEQQLYNRLQISYDQLDEPAQTCFLYFAAYPEDFEIPSKGLLEMWVAEDLFGDDLDANVALDKAHSILNELRKRSLVDECKDYFGQRCVKMHDILRGLAMRLTTRGDEVVCENLFRPGMKTLEEFPITWLEKPLKVKRMSLIGQNIQRFPSNFIAPQLRICMVNASKIDVWKMDSWKDSISRSSLSSSLQECVIEEGFFNNMTNIKHMQICYHAHLKAIPETIGALRFLQHLNLRYCHELKELPQSIGGLGSLQHLDISDCWELRKLPKSIGGLGSLEFFDMSHCRRLKELPESIGGLGSLKDFDICGCIVLEELPKSIGGLGSLEVLNISHCYMLNELPESIRGLRSLKHLNVSNCHRFKELPESIGGLRSLEKLNMSLCFMLIELPESIGGLGSLKHIDMTMCRTLKELPEGIRGWGSLEELNMSDCGMLKKLPESIGGLGSLKHIDMTLCHMLKELPESIKRWGSLEKLNMSNCGMLKELPESIGGLGSLKVLVMSHCCMLKGLPESIGGLGSLKVLVMNHCCMLKELPESIGGLGSLKVLVMNHCCMLKELPESIRGLGSLKVLAMNHCSMLKELPESIGGLGSLTMLVMSHCCVLKELPESIGGLGSLKVLVMNHCCMLKELPESIGGLGSLKFLNMTNCCVLKELPKSMARLQSLQRVYLNSCVALNELPDAIGGLGSLQELGLRGCEALANLPTFTNNIRLKILC